MILLGMSYKECRLLLRGRINKLENYLKNWRDINKEVEVKR